MKRNSGNLICQDFNVRRKVGEIVRVEASFFLNIDLYDNERISDAIKRINDTLASSEGISLVAGQETPRCSYCGTLAQKSDDRICGQCGGGL